jgi:hypothetical protein
VDVIGTEDNVFMVYDVCPRDVESDNDALEFPDYLSRYVRFGVVSRAYDAETDGRIPTLSKLWADRYKAGISTVKRFVRNRKQDRDYRLTTKPQSSRLRSRHPRLPSTYPSVGP